MTKALLSNVVARTVVGPHSIDEAKHAELIEHPNVYRIKLATAWDGWHVVVMNWVNGPTLSQRIRQGPIPEKQAITIFRGICEGVRAAHEHEVLHLDLKPENVLLRDGTVPVVADFGFASAKSSGRGGTPDYMAPEQKRGQRLDRRTDVFALGKILGELIPTSSRRMRDVIRSACAESPEQRPGTVGDLLRQVDAARRGWFLSVGLPAAAAALVLAISLGWMVLWHSGEHATAPQASSTSVEPLHTESTVPVAATVATAPAVAQSAHDAELPAVHEAASARTTSASRQERAGAGAAATVDSGLPSSPSISVADDQLTGDERLSRMAQRVAAASTDGDPPACSLAARDFLSTYRRSSPSTMWNNDSVAMALVNTALRLGNAGRCDDGRAMLRLRNQVFFAGGQRGSMSDEGSDAQFAQLVERCPTASAVANGKEIQPCCAAIKRLSPGQPGYDDVVAWCSLPGATPASSIKAGLRKDARRFRVPLPPECQ